MKTGGVFLARLRDSSLKDSIWSYEIDRSSVEKAKTIIDYVIEQKFSLMGPEIKVVTTVSGDDPLREAE